MSRKICIITPGTIASNPRVVKEAEALSGAGYRVHLIYTRHVHYLVKRDQGILNEHPEWSADYLDWCSPGFKPQSIKFISGLQRRAAKFLLSKGWYNKSHFPFLFNRFYSWQLKKAVSRKADLYIAHYPESIAVAANAAKINKAVFAFDAEDYHRGEDLPEEVTSSIRIMEDTWLPFAKYITAASPLIAAAYHELFPGVPVCPVENLFRLKDQPAFQIPDDADYTFFWFSQTVGPKRGLEEFIIILGNLRIKNIRLTLLGNINGSYKTKLIRLWSEQGHSVSKLIFMKTVPEKEIFELSARHHFGLCLERPLVPNKEICLSNKLYTYILSGNLLILSETAAQKKFHEDFPESGILIDLENAEYSAEKIKALMADKQLINQMRQTSYQLGTTKLNFDREKEVLLKQIANVWE